MLSEPPLPGTPSIEDMVNAMEQRMWWILFGLVFLLSLNVVLFITDMLNRKRIRKLEVLLFDAVPSKGDIRSHRDRLGYYGQGCNTESNTQWRMEEIATGRVTIDTYDPKHSLPDPEPYSGTDFEKTRTDFERESQWT